MVKVNVRITFCRYDLPEPELSYDSVGKAELDYIETDHVRGRTPLQIMFKQVRRHSVHQSRHIWIACELHVMLR